MQLKNTKQIIFTLLSLVVVDCFRWISYSGFLNLEIATYLAFVLIYASIYILIKIASKSGWKSDTPAAIQTLLKTWFVFNCINFIRGLFMAQDYWDYKYLFFSVIPFIFVWFAFFVGNNIHKALVVFKFVLKFLFPFGFLLIPLTFITNKELYSRIMIPISLFILFIPFVKVRHRILIVLVAVVSILMVIDFRTNIIKISFSVFLLILYFLKVNYRLLRVVNLFLFFIPIVLFGLATTDTFNIFTDISENKNLKIETNSETGESMADDSRSFLYYEVFQSITDDGNFFIGSGYTHGYKSIGVEVLGGSSVKDKRYECEVGILNELLHSGVLGVLMYFLILFKVTFLAIRDSNNQLSKILGLFIAFRWLLSFIEEFTQYDLNFYFFWLTIGLVSSSTFRSLSDKQIKNMFFIDA